MNLNMVTGWIGSLMSIFSNAANTVIAFVNAYKDKLIIVVLIVAGGWAMAKGSKLFSLNTKLNLGKK